MSCLSTDKAFASCLVLQGLGVCHKTSQECGQHLGMPYLFSFLLLLGLGFTCSLFLKVLVVLWTISSKEAVGPAAVTVVTLS